MELIVISIGTLSKNPLWNERTPVRTSHATTTLVRSDKNVILVDPSLPGQILEPKIFERTGLKAEAITAVFLTSWRPVHRRGLGLFEHAPWYMHGAEIEGATEALNNLRNHARQTNQPEPELLQQERDLLQRVTEVPEHLAEGVDPFPLPGYTVGHCGLIVAQPTATIIIAGDAVPTAAHFSAGQVFPDAFDLEQAKASMHEMYEIADQIVPGHDNVFNNPRVAGM